MNTFVICVGSTGRHVVGVLSAQPVFRESGNREMFDFAFGLMIA